MKKIDLKKELKHLYRTSAKEVALVDVPAKNYLIVDGACGGNGASDTDIFAVLNFRSRYRTIECN